jgi:hypothetical protein
MKPFPVRPTDAVSYEAPRLTELGSLSELTLVQDKKLGHSDGFTFMGQSITNASP